MFKPGLPQGTRDFDADTVRKREYILHIIENVFKLYGFEPLETPAMENIETLMGKYGDEGDKLIFKILNNGLSDPKNIDKSRSAFKHVIEGKNDKNLTERALRYDLTIPFARYVAMNHGQLTFPFRRYQIQPVWRADRPQKGRYREFYQCDADVVGSHSLISEIELLSIFSEVFTALGIEVEIKINSRKILAALAILCGNADMLAITTAIDKLDKIGPERVIAELLTKNISPNQVLIIQKYLSIMGSNDDKLVQIKILLENIDIGIKGIADLEYILKDLHATISPNLILDFTLARGLNYYTGVIFEVKSRHVQIGSIGAGGRYDDLTGLFGLPGIPGVGISFGVDRIYDVMETLQVFPANVYSGTQVLFFNMGEQESRYAFSIMQQLRSRGVRCELYHEQAKFDKQFKYADKKRVAYAVIIGSREIEEGNCIVKNLQKGEQQIISIQQLLAMEL